MKGKNPEKINSAHAFDLPKSPDEMLSRFTVPVCVATCFHPVSAPGRSVSA